MNLFILYIFFYLFIFLVILSIPSIPIPVLYTGIPIFQPTEKVHPTYLPTCA